MSYRKYYLTKYQVSYDGINWEDVLDEDGNVIYGEGEEIASGLKSCAEKVEPMLEVDPITMTTNETKPIIVNTNSQGEITAYSNNPSIVDIDDNGNLVAYSTIGSTSIVVTVGEDDNFLEKQAIVNVEVKKIIDPKTIIYTTSDGLTAQTTNTTGLNSLQSMGLVSNTYENGIGKMVFDKDVTNIGEYAFDSCTNLTSVTIPSSVTSIGDRVFRNCSNLTSITIPNSVTSIGHSAFYNCTSLTSIEIPNSVTSIGGSAFENCTSLTSITLGDSVTSIDRRTFYWCWGLKKITIPNSVTSIGESAFGSCRWLTSITISNSVTEIGDSAFHYCDELKHIYYDGTISQWNAITKGDYWKNLVPTTCKVHCTDGTIPI